jgi:hypothetical protein
MYALAFEKMHIPYVIKEEPRHIYLIAYPGPDQLILQTTSPTGVSRAISSDFKQRFVTVLVDQKVIGSNEAVGSIDAVFDKYYFEENAEIDLIQLAGIQYLNEGLIALEEKKHEEAIKDLQKAYYLYPTERAPYTLMLASYMSLNSYTKKDMTISL